MVKKAQTTQEPATITTTVEDDTFDRLSRKLAEINKHPQVTGYIMRNATSAIINLKNNQHLTETALLAAQTAESATEIARLFNMGAIDSVVITGKDAKTLCTVIGENNISVTMEKNADHDNILQQIKHSITA
ncbi:MAG: hypothetical protein NWE94_01305 [Candidatus Bathyarchaeota archaeon]|nr:hypothetical protein [Candidatus Bathyarchaeota archaeon]